MEGHQTAKFDEKFCVIFRNGFETEADQMEVTREITNLIKFIELHGRDELHKCLIQRSSTVPPGQILLHSDCRRQFESLLKLDDQPESLPTKKKKLLSGTTTFHWKRNCFVLVFFYTNSVLFGEVIKNKGMRIVQMLPFRDDLLLKCRVAKLSPVSSGELYRACCFRGSLI